MQSLKDWLWRYVYLFFQERILKFIALSQTCYAYSQNVAHIVHLNREGFTLRWRHGHEVTVVIKILTFMFWLSIAIFQ